MADPPKPVIVYPMQLHAPDDKQHGNDKKRSRPMKLPEEIPFMSSSPATKRRHVDEKQQEKAASSDSVNAEQNTQQLKTVCEALAINLDKLPSKRFTHQLKSMDKRDRASVTQLFKTASNAMAGVICPRDRGALVDTLRPTAKPSGDNASSDSAYLDVIIGLCAEAQGVYATSAVEARVLRAVLSQLPGKRVEPFLHLSRSQYNKGKVDAEFLRKGVDLPRKVQTRQRVSDEVVENAIKFILAGDNIYFISTMPKELWLDDHRVKIPAIAREKNSVELYKDYKQQLMAAPPATGSKSKRPILSYALFSALVTELTAMMPNARERFEHFKRHSLFDTMQATDLAAAELSRELQVALGEESSRFKALQERISTVQLQMKNIAYLFQGGYREHIRRSWPASTQMQCCPNHCPLFSIDASTLPLPTGPTHLKADHNNWCETCLQPFLNLVELRTIASNLPDTKSREKYQTGFQHFAEKIRNHMAVTLCGEHQRSRFDHLKLSLGANEALCSVDFNHQIIYRSIRRSSMPVDYHTMVVYTIVPPAESNEINFVESSYYTEDGDSVTMYVTFIDVVLLSDCQDGFKSLQAMEASFVALRHLFPQVQSLYLQSDGERSFTSCVVSGSIYELVRSHDLQLKMVLYKESGDDKDHCRTEHETAVRKCLKQIPSDKWATATVEDIFAALEGNLENTLVLKAASIPPEPPQGDLIRLNTKDYAAYQRALSFLDQVSEYLCVTFSAAGDLECRRVCDSVNVAKEFDHKLMHSVLLNAWDDKSKGDLERLPLPGVDLNQVHGMPGHDPALSMELDGDHDADASLNRSLGFTSITMTSAKVFLVSNQLQLGEAPDLTSSSMQAMADYEKNEQFMRTARSVTSLFHCGTCGKSFRTEKTKEKHQCRSSLTSQNVINRGKRFALHTFEREANRFQPSVTLRGLGDEPIVMHSGPQIQSASRASQSATQTDTSNPSQTGKPTEMKDDVRMFLQKLFEKNWALERLAKRYEVRKDRLPVYVRQLAYDLHTKGTSGRPIKYIEARDYMLSARDSNGKLLIHPCDLPDVTDLHSLYQNFRTFKHPVPEIIYYKDELRAKLEEKKLKVTGGKIAQAYRLNKANQGLLTKEDMGDGDKDYGALPIEELRRRLDEVGKGHKKKKDTTKAELVQLLYQHDFESLDKAHLQQLVQRKGGIPSTMTHKDMVNFMTQMSILSKYSTDELVKQLQGTRGGVSNPPLTHDLHKLTREDLIQSIIELNKLSQAHH